MSKLSNVSPSKRAHQEVDERTRQEVLGFCASKTSAFLDPNFHKDPIHRAIKFLAEGKKKKANEIINTIKEKISSSPNEQYITEKQEEIFMKDDINQREKI
tara:strand:- start:597 stop:899 length:303 start_codon:yes stop_codon:yes gene_type:complete